MVLNVKVPFEFSSALGTRPTLLFIVVNERERESIFHVYWSSISGSFLRAYFSLYTFLRISFKRTFYFSFALAASYWWITKRKIWRKFDWIKVIQNISSTTFSRSKLYESHNLIFLFEWKCGNDYWKSLTIREKFERFFITVERNK